MHPEICKIGPFTVYSYGLMLALAFLASSYLARSQAKREGVNPDIIFNLAFISFIAGIAGARLFYIIQNFGFYMENPVEIMMLSHGGLSWIGGLILGVLSGIVYLKVKKVAVFKAMDLIAPFIAFGQAIGRIGCFLNGCCYGEESSFGIYFPVHKQVLIPTQIYSSLALVFIFVVLRFFQDRPHKLGKIFFTYLLLYSLKRFIVEFWRGDNQVIFLGLTLFQVTSAIVFCVAITGLIFTKKSSS